MFKKKTVLHILMVGNEGCMQTETMPCHLKTFSSALQ